MPINDIILTVISSSVFLIPIFTGMYLLRFWKFRVTGVYYLFSLYLCIVYRLTGLPDITYLRWDPDVAFIPFIAMVGDLRSTVLNVALFLPLGIALPLFWKRYEDLNKTIILGSLISLGIETAQLFTYRATDINDLITNISGTFLGYLVYKVCLPNKFANIKDDVPMLLGIICTVMFFGEPIVHGILDMLL